MSKIDKSTQVMLEAVRAEIHTQLGELLKLLEADLLTTFNEFNGRLNDLLGRIEVLEGAEPIPSQKPKSDSGVEL